MQCAFGCIRDEAKINFQFFFGNSNRFIPPWSICAKGECAAFIWTVWLDLTWPFPVGDLPLNTDDSHLSGLSVLGRTLSIFPERGHTCNNPDPVQTCLEQLCIHSTRQKKALMISWINWNKLIISTNVLRVISPFLFILIPSQSVSLSATLIQFVPQLRHSSDTVHISIGSVSEVEHLQGVCSLADTFPFSICFVLRLFFFFSVCII